jgi:hypothetical protein
MKMGTTSYTEDRYGSSMLTLPSLEKSLAQTLPWDRKEMLQVLGGSIGSTAQPTFNYRLSGTDTLDWGDQSAWVEIKGVLSLLEELRGRQSFSQATKYSALVGIFESQRLHHHYPHQLEEIYSLRDASVVRRFLYAHPQLIEFLLEAHVHLQKHFGPDPQVELAVVSDPEAEGEEQLFAYILTSLPVDEALARLDRLDEEWFLDQLDRVDGRFNFNLEFV